MRAELEALADDRLRRLDEVWPKNRREGKRPPFWSDLAVRRLVIAYWCEASINATRAAIIAAVGEDRCPSRTTIGRFWQRLDALIAED